MSVQDHDNRVLGEEISNLWTQRSKTTEACIRYLIKAMGDDPDRPGMVDTPRRVMESWKEFHSGYFVCDEEEDQVISLMLTIFDGIPYDGIVLMRDIEFYSHCLAGSTFIETPKGRIPISRLKDGEFVYCWDEDNKKMTLARAINPRITGRNKRLYRIYSDKDTILCTGNHKFLTFNRGWVKAKKLILGDSIVALNKGTMMHYDTARCYLRWTGKTKQVPEHKFVYEEINGPADGDHIHHINRKTNDNSPENLTKLAPSKHARLHRLKDGPTGFALYTDTQRAAMKAKQIEGIKRSQTKEVKKKRSASLRQYWKNLSEEERAERNHRILMVQKTNWREDVWCMDVPGYENFVANGMVVHNCEHHLVPFYGKAHIAYIPGKEFVYDPKFPDMKIVIPDKFTYRVVGLSKLARLLDIKARRFTVQENITTGVTDALVKYLKPLGAACIIEAKHFCVCARGVGKQHSEMVTSSMTGTFFDADGTSRNELFSLINRR